MAKPLTWERTGSPLSTGDLDALEAELGIKLPSKYRSFLLAQNGGRPSRRWFLIPDHFDGEDEVGDMLAVGNPYEHCDLAASWRTYHEYASRGLLPIGWTSSSGMIGIDLSTPGEEPVIYMEWSDPDPPETRKPYRLARDIEEFCAQLGEDYSPTLAEVVSNLASADLDGTIYAAEPWTPSSQAIVAREPEGGGIPEAAQSAGLAYVLEVSVALEVLEAFAAQSGDDVALKARVERIIDYALRDA